MALTKITSSVVAVNSLTAANIADNSIDSTKIANNQILARHIAADALSDQIADNSITAGMIPNATALTLDGGLTIDNITIDGTEIDLSSGDLTLDVAGDIILDVAGSDVIYKRSGTSVGEIQIGDDNFNIRSLVSDKDLIFKGNDAGTTVTALTLDMSAAGAATFNAGGTFGGAVQLNDAQLNVHSSSASALIGSIGNTANDLNIFSTSSGHNGLRFHSNGILPTDNSGTIINNDADLGDPSYTFKNLYLGGYASVNALASPDGTSIVYPNNNGNVGVGNNNPQHPFIVHLTDGEVAMFGSNGMNSAGAYAGIGLGQVLANNTTYQKIKIVAEGRDNGNYVSNLHFLVDVAADGNSAVLADSKMMIDGGYGYLGVGLTDPKSRAEFHLDQVSASTDVNRGSSVHFGSQQHTDGAMMGITLGYREASLNYRKVGIFAEGRGDNAARQNLLLCVDTANDSGSARDADAKITIDGLSGECKIGNTTVETETYCLKVQTQFGYGRQGSANSSYFHHETDRAYNYWNEAGYFSGGAHTYSDETLKKDVVVIPNALASVAKMNGVTFNWIDPEKRGGKGTGTGKQFGVIAQNMLEVDAELPTLSVDPLAAGGNEETDDKLYSMDYARLSPYFIEAIKELKTKLEAAEARIKTLEG